MSVLAKNNLVEHKKPQDKIVVTRNHPNSAWKTELNDLSQVRKSLSNSVNLVPI